MKNNQDTNLSKKERILNWLKGAFTHNLGTKILALIFAMILWGYVLTQINPTRVKAVQDVRVSFDGESDLLERGLVVRGNRDEILNNVVVRVKTELTQYADLSADDVNATINLNTISKTGTITLPIRAYTSVGSADRVSPPTVTLEIDNYAEKSVPVTVQYEGTLPEGYWNDQPQLSNTEVTIRGAATDVNRISKAVCVVPLTDRTESYNEAVNLTILDSNGEELSSDLFIGENPSITVRMRVLPKKTVPINLDGAILGSESLPANYEVVEKKTNPETVTIIGTAETLAAVDSIDIEGIDLSGRTESLHDTRRLKLPEGVEIQSNITEVEVYINIQEKQLKKTFVQVPIEVNGLAKGLRASLSMANLDVSISGRTTLVSMLDADDVKLIVDVSKLGEGSYQLPVELELSNKSILQEVMVNLSSGQSMVTEVLVTIDKS